jgi:mono/diheme cytochrome c family protein
MNLINQSIVWSALAGLSTLAYAQPAPGETRGELLYSTHCVACHTTQMHWRNDRQAFDWESLKFQVRRWQGNAGLAWSDADIAEVSRYLNESIYHYPQMNDRVGLVSSGTVQLPPRK